MTKRMIPLVLAALLAGCATTGSGGSGMNGPADVIRYHLGQPIPPGTVTVEPLMNGAGVTPESQLYADAVAGELAKLGFQPSPAGAPSQYIAAVGFRLTPAGIVQKRPPITIGIGGGSFGGGVGLGGGVSTGIGGKRYTLLATELSVQLRRRSDGTMVWEGRAKKNGIEGRDQPVSAADILADALFRGFPGESGITITVP
jgi:hypothetical protein